MLRGEGWEEQRNEKQTKYKKKIGSHTFYFLSVLVANKVPTLVILEKMSNKNTQIV